MHSLVHINLIMHCMLLSTANFEFILLSPEVLIRRNLMNATSEATRIATKLVFRIDFGVTVDGTVTKSVLYFDWACLLFSQLSLYLKSFKLLLDHAWFIHHCELFFVLLHLPFTAIFFVIFSAGKRMLNFFRCFVYFLIDC